MLTFTVNLSSPFRRTKVNREFVRTIGIFVLGLMTTGAVIFSGLKDFLADFQGPVGVGPLAGKTVLAVVAWLVSWGVMHSMWKDRDYDLPLAFKIGVALGILGAILTFPPVFEAFE